MTTCKERVKQLFPWNVYQLREKIFDKLDSFSVPYSDDQKFFRSVATFVDFESIRAQGDKFRDIETKTWISRRVPISVPFSSNLIEQPIFLCNSNPGTLVELLVDALDGLATQSKVQMIIKLLDIETSVKSKLKEFFSALNLCRCCKEPVLEFEKEYFEKKKSNKCGHNFNKHKRINSLI